MSSANHVPAKRWQDEPHAPAPGTFLCRSAEVGAGAAREFRFGPDPAFAFRLFVYRDRDGLRAFWNSCPHFYVPLHYRMDRLLSPDGSHFVCMTHHAKFETRHGACVAGPCAGEGLQRIPLRCEDGQLFIAGPGANEGYEQEML